MRDAAGRPVEDADVPTSAGMYDAFLRGSHHTPAERAAADRITESMPEIYDAAWANRGFLQRAVRWLAEQGIRQFIDVGAGLPAQNATHQVVAGTGARVVYVDKDPRVQVRAEAMLAEEPLAIAVTADLREVETVLARAGELLDYREPVALLLIAVLHFVPDSDDPRGLIRRYLRALAPGSYLALSHITLDHQPDEPVERIRNVYRGVTEQVAFRSRDEIARFFDDVELVRPHPHAAPALTYVGEWGAEDPSLADSDGSRWGYSGLARIP
jgi:SAM-dependent methyltransferase